MRLTSVRRIIPMLALVALPAYAGAQETQLFTWTGRVDREVRLSIQGNSVSSNATRGEEYRGRFSVGSPMPRMDGNVRVVVTGGRGEVSVAQQPNSGNNYTAVIRMVDRSSGADRYQVTAFFTPSNGGQYGNNGNYDNRGNNGNNGNYDNRGNNGYGRGNRQPAVLHWSGMVDATAEVRWQDGMVRQRAIDGNALRRVRSSVTGGRGNGRMRQGAQATVQLREGRGQVDIVQQPNASNGFTTIIRITDPQDSYGRYNFDVTVQ